MEKSSVIYKEAIDKLRSYMAKETDEDNIDEAAAKIRDFRFKIIDEAFDDINKRTKRMTTLIHELQAIIDNASKGSKVQKAVDGLISLTTKAKGLLDKIPKG